MSEQWRVFCAIDLPPQLKQKLADHGEQLREAEPDAHASWTRPDNIHLTLKFLGNVNVPDVAKLSQAAERAVVSVPRFKLTAEGPGTFPKNGPPRVLWIGISDPDEQLARLHASLENEGAKLGFAKEARAFHPHLTLARLRSSKGAKALGAAHRARDFEPVEISVSELLVIRSELGREGSRYSVISRHQLEEQ